MEAIVCQAAEAQVAEIADAPVESIATLSSSEMSYVGGAILIACFL